MNEIETHLQEALVRAQQALAVVTTSAEIEECHVRFLGRKGEITVLLKSMGAVPAEDRPQVGRTANRVKQEIEAAFAAAKAALSRQETVVVQAVDVTLPVRLRHSGYLHPVARVMDDAVAIFRRLGFVVADGPDLETVHHNFDALNTPAEHPSRDVKDTFYLADGRCLRTQTSPVQVRVMERQPPPVRIICPGRCYRRDTPDATHSMNFHQIEGLYVDRRVSLADLKGVLAEFAREMMGAEVKVRFRPHFFPFTEPSIEYDFSCIICGGKGCGVCKHSGWLEISGAGMVDPAVFTAVGYDPETWTGYAFGMGIERIAMIRHAINDIRLLYENDVRFLAQF
jgi:phenylalanyl-tRNA synthetase alpha chain